MLIPLTHGEVERLYDAPGFDQDRPEAVLARAMDGSSTAALCYTLPAVPPAEERNPDYAPRLQQVLLNLE